VNKRRKTASGAGSRYLGILKIWIAIAQPAMIATNDSAGKEFHKNALSVRIQRAIPDLV
jgi:hypothetical protein